MVRKSFDYSHRQIRKSPQKTGWVLAIVFLMITLIFWIIFKQDIEVISLVQIGNPVRVSWFGSGITSPVNIQIPANTYIRAVRGYGTYSLESLWRLAIIEKDLTIFTDSLSLLIGVPIKYVSAETSTDTPVFNVSNWIGALTGKFKTNISLPLYTKILLTQPHVSDRTVEIVFQDVDGEKQILPDGSSIVELKSDVIDNKIGNLFELGFVRNENKTIAIYNSTDIAGIGQELARVFNKIGINVVTVANENADNSGSTDNCLLKWNSEVSKSKTFKFISDYLKCNSVKDETLVRSDISLFLEKATADRFGSVSRN